MVFSSLIFVCVFLPLVVAVYFALPRRANNLILVIASFVFYAWGDATALLLLVPSIILNFSFGRMIDAAGGGRRRGFIVASVSINIGVLVVFKYAGFIADNVNALLDVLDFPRLTRPAVDLPLGISFFTFHIVSYLIDVYRGVTPALRSLAAFTLYIVNFPQLIAGPIVRYQQIAEQLVSREATFEDVDAGIARFAAGLGKKVLIANPIGEISDWVFAVPGGDVTMPTAWFGVLCYALQIYFDFSGYSDMAIGLARIFGFRFPENFNYPYAATSIQEFWQRWHISLSAWFRDYVYVPLGGNRFGGWTTARNLWIVFLLAGVWHGANWTFVVWGLWYGLFLSIERTTVVQRVLSSSPRGVRIAYVALVVLVGWVVFRAPSLDAANALLSRMFMLTAPDPGSFSVFGLVSGRMLTLIGLACCFSFPVSPWVQSLWNRFGQRGRGSVGDIVRACLVAAVVIMSLATLSVEQSNAFLYFRF